MMSGVEVMYFMVEVVYHISVWLVGGKMRLVTASMHSATDHKCKESNGGGIQYKSPRLFGSKSIFDILTLFTKYIRSVKMRDLFPGFYKRTEEDLAQLWQEGFFVFDTNMLLNVYRYTHKTRDRYFEILNLLKNRNQLWIPYQAAYEYQDRRMDVIQGQLEAYKEISIILQDIRQKLESSLEQYKSKHGFINSIELSKEIIDTIKKAKEKVTQDKANDKGAYEALKKHDSLLEVLEGLFQGNVGNPYDRSKLEEIYKHAQLRVELKIPPGWEDEGKKSYRKYGDVVLWFQLMDFARGKKKPIIFVTDDGKKDWWLPEAKCQERDRPLPELVQEMFVEAGVLLHMYQGYEFLKQAEVFLKLEEKPDVIEEAKEVTQQNTLEQYQGKRSGITVSQIWAYEAERAVLAWLKSRYPQTEIMTHPNESPDFTLENLDGERIGVEVKFLPERMFQSSSFLQNSILNAMIKSYNNVRGEGFNELWIYFVTNNSENASTIYTSIENLANINPEFIHNIIGYVSSTGQFIPINA